MLTVTDAASSYLADMLSSAEAPDETAVRFVYESGGLQLQADAAQPGDATFDHEGRTVLVMNQEVAELLTDRTLDVHDEAGEPRLVLR